MSKNMTNEHRILQSIFENQSLMPKNLQQDIYDYVEADLDGKDVKSLFPALDTYLDNCDGQDGDYLAVLSVLETENSGAFGEPPVSFWLDTKEIREQIDKPSIPEQVKQWFINEFSQPIVQLSQDLLDAFTPPLEPQFVKGDDHLFFEYSIENEIDDMNISMTAKSSRQNPERCSLSIGVDIPSRDGWPHLGGIEVMLKESGESMNTVAVQKTDAHGTVIFKELERSQLPDLLVQIDESR